LPLSALNLPAGPTITDVNVGLQLSGGWNGDLYAYLVHSSGFAVLLNRVGRGTGNAAVPEPASLIEASVAALFLGGAICLFRLKGKKAQAPVAA
jgi:hypothetical protein